MAYAFPEFTASSARIVVIAAAFAALGGLPAWAGLLSGVVLALCFGNADGSQSRKLIHPLLAYSIIGLGAGMNLHTVALAGLHGLGYTFASISAVFALGILLGKVLGTERKSSILITIGTGICGGSAIAAAAPTIRAKPHEVSVALATVFLLNALALLAFPAIGHWVSLTEDQFGLWAALAIHDTSSVVGATLQYGPHALEVGTTIKLARALWIIPVTLGLGALEIRRSRETSGEETRTNGPKIPWFIFGFVLTAGIFTVIPALQPIGHGMEWVAKRSLVFALFLIGFSLDRLSLKTAGVRPLVQGAGLWIATASASLFVIWEKWI